jgi:hypothetical protein
MFSLRTLLYWRHAALLRVATRSGICGGGLAKSTEYGAAGFSFDMRGRFLFYLARFEPGQNGRAAKREGGTGCF